MDVRKKVKNELAFFKRMVYKFITELRDILKLFNLPVSSDYWDLYMYFFLSTKFKHYLSYDW